MVIRVLWLVKGLGPGGAEHLLAASAEAHDRRRFSIECAYVVPEKDHLTERLERAGVRCHCLSERAGDPLWPNRLRALVANGDWDIVHAHSPLLAAAGRIAVRSTRASVRPALISTEHNEWSTFAPPTRIANRVTSRLDDAVLAVSDSTRRSMSGRAADRAVVVHHGVDVDTVAGHRADRDAARREFGLAPNEFVIGTVANYRAQKDYPNLLRAMRALVDEGGSMRLVAIGQGPLASMVEALVDELDLRDHVVLTGHRSDATRLMSAFDVFTLASLREGLPVALMDAFALGLPVVATNVGGVADVLVDGRDAVLVAPGDAGALASAWRRLHDDGALRQRLAAESAERSPAFDIRRAVERIESTYAELASRPARWSASSMVPTVPATIGEIEIREATGDDRRAILALGRHALGWPDDERTDELFAWKHDENAFGPSFAYVAVADEQIIGFRAFMRWGFRRGDETFDAVRAVDTVTDPAWQGRGVFRALTLHGVDELRDANVDFVFNTPNDASRPGYLAMGWREVGSIPAAVRFAGPRGAIGAVSNRVPADLWSLPSVLGVPFDDWFDGWFDGATEPVISPASARQIVTDWTPDRLRWRFGGERLGYRVVPGSRDATGVVVRERRRGSGRELVALLAIGLEAAEADAIVGRVARRSGVSHVLRLGAPAPRRGFVPMPGGGPTLTSLPLATQSTPSLANWCLTMGDVELF